MNLSTLSRRGALAAAFFLSLATSVLAEERFQLQGTHAERGAFRSEVTLEGEGDQVQVQRQVWWSDGTTSVYQGTLPRRGAVVQGRLQTAGGAAGAIQGRAGEEIRFAFRVGEPCQSKAQDASGPSKASGARVEQAPPKAVVVEEEAPKAIVVEEAEKPSLYQRAKGRLIGLAKKEAEKALRKGASTGIDLGDYGHVGIRGRVERVENLSANQEAALRRGPSVWVASEYQGAARVGGSGRVDLGGVGVGIGIRAGTELNYRIVERYDLPPGQGSRTGSAT